MLIRNGKNRKSLYNRNRNRKPPFLTLEEATTVKWQPVKNNSLFAAKTLEKGIEIGPCVGLVAVDCTEDGAKEVVRKFGKPHVYFATLHDIEAEENDDKKRNLFYLTGTKTAVWKEVNKGIKKVIDVPIRIWPHKKLDGDGNPIRIAPSEYSPWAMANFGRKSANVKLYPCAEGKWPYFTGLQRIEIGQEICWDYFNGWDYSRCSSRH